MATTKQTIADHLAEHAHTWIICATIVFIVLYFIFGKSDAGSADEFVGKTVLVLVSAVGFPSGFFALLFMACLKSTDFSKLEKFQFYLILGTGLSTLAAAIVLLQAFGIQSIAHTVPGNANLPAGDQVQTVPKR